MKRSSCSQQSSDFWQEEDKVYHNDYDYDSEYKQKDDEDGSAHTYLAALLERNTH